MTARFRIGFFSLLILLVFLLPTAVRADTITDTVKDPSGGVVPGARIEIAGEGNIAAHRPHHGRVRQIRRPRFGARQIFRSRHEGRI